MEKRVEVKCKSYYCLFKPEIGENHSPQVTCGGGPVYSLDGARK